MQKGSIATDKALLGEATEICAMFTASLKTSRRNWQAQQNAGKRKKRVRSVVVKVPDAKL